MSNKLQLPTFEELFSYENLVLCSETCLRGVRWKNSVQNFNLFMYNECAKIHEEIMDGTYRSKGFHVFKINERGKTRVIRSVHITERVVQKVLCQFYLRPLLERSLIYDNGASLEGKGTHFAIKRFREHLRWHYARFGLEGGILIGDFHKYFDSIDHNRLYAMLEKKVTDPKILEMCKYFIGCFKGDVGLGLGSEISQICAIYYPNKMDHMVKEEFQIHGYARYMDDFYVICEDIEKLQSVYKAIIEISNELGLELNLKRTQIFKFKDNPVFTFLKSKTTLSDNGKIVMRLVHSNVKNKRDKLRQQRKQLTEGLITFDYILQSMRVWIGYAFQHKMSYETIQATINYFRELFYDEFMQSRYDEAYLEFIGYQIPFFRVAA